MAAHFTGKDLLQLAHPARSPLMDHRDQLEPVLLAHVGIEVPSHLHLKSMKGRTGPGGDLVDGRRIQGDLRGVGLDVPGELERGGDLPWRLGRLQVRDREAQQLPGQQVLHFFHGRGPFTLLLPSHMFGVLQSGHGRPSV